MSGNSVKEKLIQHFNEVLAMENAAVERIQARVNETPVEMARQQMQYHLEQTMQQQDRLRKIISDLGGSPTDSKAALPKLAPSSDAETVSERVAKKAAARSTAGGEGEKKRSGEKKMMMMDAEKELMRAKEDAIIENAEVVSYKMLMEVAKKAGMKDVVPVLKQSMQEEVAMANFIAASSPMMLSLLWPELEEEFSPAQAAAKAKKNQQVMAS